MSSRLSVLTARAIRSTPLATMRRCRSGRLSRPPRQRQRTWPFFASTCWAESWALRMSTSWAEHAARQGLDLRVAAHLEADQFQYLVDELGPAAALDAVAAGEVVQVLPDQQVVVEAEEVRHVADERVDLQRLLEDVDAGNAHVTV